MRNSMLAIALLGSLVVGSAFAQTSGHHVVVVGNSVELRVNTGPVQQTCSYAFSVAFADGTSEGANGTTDPTVNAQNHLAASRSYNKAVRSAQLNTWSCSKKS